VGISTVFKILVHFLFRGWGVGVKERWDHPVWFRFTYPQKFLDTRKKNMYSLGVEISKVIAFNTRNKNIYDLGVGISIVFEIFSQFPISGGMVDPRPYLMYCMYCL
jgi:hypothetical protein